MRLYAILLIGTLSIFFQLTKFNSFNDFICLLCSILLVLLIIYINYKNLTKLYNNFYNKFYILSFLILINNTLIYMSLPNLFLIILKIIITIVLFWNIICMVNEKYNIYSKK